MGYKTIFLHGNDFTWINDLQVDENNVVWDVDTHCYDNERKLTRSRHNMYGVKHFTKVF